MKFGFSRVIIVAIYSICGSGVRIRVDSLARPPPCGRLASRSGALPAFLSSSSFMEPSLWRLGCPVRGLLPIGGQVVRLVPTCGLKRLPGAFPRIFPGRVFLPGECCRLRGPGVRGGPAFLRSCPEAGVPCTGNGASRCSRGNLFLCSCSS